MSYALKPLALEPLPLGAVKPAGWLRDQLRIQADGLSGHLAAIWPDVAQSAWIGGTADGWERGPYWLDGFVPLAVLLDDPALKATARQWIDAILARQHPDGWLGPVRGDPKLREARLDPWPVFVALKAMTQWQEATGDERVIPAMGQFFRRLDTLLDQEPLYDWGRYRWSDLAVSLFWLYERTGDEGLLRLAAKSHQQSFGWQEHFAHFPYHQKQHRDAIFPADPQAGMTFRLDMASHVVNNAMAIKQPAVWWRVSGDPADRDASAAFIATLDRYHGQVTGVFTGDEHLAGTSPSQGTELCAVVEYLFSLETLVAITGDAALGDRLERIAFNALPATFSPDMWTHQYVQQANQVQCRIVQDRVYTNNGPDANIFGLEPHFGCCTANMHQGWPKFAASLWMRAPDGALAAISYAPCVVNATLNEQPVIVTVETTYPWEERVSIVVETDAPVEGALLLRVPAWAEGATVDDREVAAGTFHRVERRWDGRTTVELRLPMRVHIHERPSGAVAVERGPLVYSLPIGERWEPVAPHNRSGATDDPRVQYDYEVVPTTAWNYALVIDPDDPGAALAFESRGVGERPFSPIGAPVALHARGVVVPDWGIEHGAAAPPPAAPATTGSPEPLTLIPYGCTTLRVTEFPLANMILSEEPST
jgi:uncharacterized protein